MDDADPQFTLWFDETLRYDPVVKQEQAAAKKYQPKVSLLGLNSDEEFSESSKSDYSGGAMSEKEEKKPKKRRARKGKKKAKKGVQN